jgi:L-fuconolactonase
MRIVDAHVHCWRRARPDGARTWREPYPVEQLLTTLEAAGVAAAVQVTPSPEGWDNDYGLEAAAAHPQKVCVFGRIDPAAPDPLQRLRTWIGRRGASGVRLTYFGANAAPRGGLLALEKFWSACEQLALPVALFAPDNLSETIGVLERHPRLQLIVDHLGLGVYPGCPEPLAGLVVLDELAAFEHVRVKVSGLVELSAEPFPFRDIHEHLARAIDTFGAERLIWGSNHPVVLAKCSYAESLQFLYECDFLRTEDLRHMLGGTITRTLARGAPAGERTAADEVEESA